MGQSVRNLRLDERERVMQIEGWRYYNHAALPDTPPHVTVDLSPIKSGDIWKIHKGCFLARWITDYDCPEATNWWYVIKDSSFNIADLKSKRRYEITKGKRFFSVRQIDPKCYKKDIYDIQVKAYSAYPAKYRPTVDCEALFEEIEEWKYYRFYGAFSNEDGTLCGYAWLNRNGNYIYYAFHKVFPECEKQGINAAIVAQILEDHEEELSSGAYLCDGSRNVSHETHFQDYLEKYFGFRKAYCKLHICYRTGVTPIIKILYPFRALFRGLDSISLFHNLNSVLKMEELSR